MSEKATGTEMFAELISLRNEAGEKHYQRVKLAANLLKDKDWVESPAGGGGDENRALDRLEVECFGDLCGLVSLTNLLELLHHFPKLEDWQRHKFNPSRMWVEYSQKTKGTKKKDSTPRKVAELPTVAEFEQFSPNTQKRTYERVLNRIETDIQKIERLEQENSALREENKTLKARIRDIKDGARKLIA